MKMHTAHKNSANEVRWQVENELCVRYIINPNLLSLMYLKNFNKGDPGWHTPDILTLKVTDAGGWLVWG